MMQRVLFVFFGTPTLRRVAGLATIFTLYSAIAVWKELTTLRDLVDHPSNVYVSMSVVLGLLLVFRTNSSYERWWEARKLWGKLVNVCRNLSIKTCTLTEADRETTRRFAELIIAFPYSLKEHLRGRHDSRQLPEAYQATVLDYGHQPNGITFAIYQELSLWRKRGWVNDDQLRIIDSESRELLEVCGGCERILKTPLARSYRVFLQQCIVLLLVTLPWGIVNDFQIWTIPIMFFEAYFMLGIECIAEAIEDPFGEHDDDLDLDGICQTIERTVHEIVQTQPVNSVTQPS